ncbi:MAG: alpha-L-fucosidase [Rikenellaceae bacterium]
MRKRLLTLLTLCAICMGASAREYKADWDDLNDYPQAEWLGDLKFGMYWHWGLTSIPGNSGWYGKYMYREGHPSFKFHQENFGDQSEYGYVNFIEDMTAEGFSAKTWIENTKNIGAKFAVGMAVHHDGYDLYHSKLNKYNSVDMTPHINVLGELEAEARKQGLMFGATSHLAYNWYFFSEFMYPNKYDAEKAPDFYNIHDPKGEPSKKFAKEWYNRTIELIDTHDLDFLWFDFGTREKAFNEKYTAMVTAHYYNQAEKKGKQVALAAKVGFNNDESLVYDIEQGKFPYISKTMWMSDCTANAGWFDTRTVEDPYVMTGEFWLYQLIDIVSKNGMLLLNLGPRTDGSWNPEWTAEMLRMGDWLKVNGEAIYYTKPWHRFGEGPTMCGDSFVYNMGHNLTLNDIRFTRKDNTLYAIVCGWRVDPFKIKSLANSDLKGLNIKSVELIGYDGKIAWSQQEDGLSVKFPNKKFGEFAYVLKIEGDNLFPEREEYVEMEIPFDFEGHNGGKALEDVREVRVTVKGDNKQLQLSELYVVGTAESAQSMFTGMYHNKIHNLSLLAAGVASSSEDDMTPDKANDNNVNGNLHMQSIARTQVESNPYIGMKFDISIKTAGVIIYPEMSEREKLMEEASLQCFNSKGEMIFDQPLKDIVASPDTKIILPF